MIGPRPCYCGRPGKIDRRRHYENQFPQPYGLWLVAIAGLVFVGVGIYQWVKSYETRFRKKLVAHQMSQTEVRWGVRAGRVGIAARGVVFGMIGAFLVQAAMNQNPQ